MKNRKTIALVIVLITIILAAIILILPIDQVLIGYSFKNGIETLTYVSKTKGIAIMLFTPVAVCLVSKTYSRKLYRKAEENPGYTSCQFNGFFSIFFCIMSSMGAIIGIINIILWLKYTY